MADKKVTKETKIEKVAVEPKPEKVAVKKSILKKAVGESKKDRKLVSYNPSRRKAIVSAGGVEYCVVRHFKRRSEEALLAGPSCKSVLEKDWLAGKVSLGLS